MFPDRIAFVKSITNTYFFGEHLEEVTLKSATESLSARMFNIVNHEIKKYIKA